MLTYTRITVLFKYFKIADIIQNKVFLLDWSNYTNSLSLIHQAGHAVIGVDEVGQAELAFHESMLSGLDLPVVLHMMCDCIQDDLFYHLSWHRSQDDRLVVLRVLPSTLLIDGCHISKSPVLGSSLHNHDC